MLLIGISFVASPIHAATVDLVMPSNAILTAEREEVATVQPLPAGVFDNKDTIFLNAEGQVRHSAYRIASTSLTPFQMLEPLKKQLIDQGYTSVFACADSVCGGYDFRYLLDILPVPHMRVDLGNFQYFLAENFSGDIVAIVASRARTAGFLHITQVDAQSTEQPVEIPPSAGLPDNKDTILSTQVPSRPLGGLVNKLITQGVVPLDDLAFETGSSTLGSGPFASLEDIADYLIRTSEAKLILVGHTDNEGSLEGNINLSRQRAASVRERLVSRYDVPSAQISAQGIGFLAPRATNVTEVGREKNRRVEAVLASPR
ncbi:OmpA family protein [Pacificibacter maritimus]|uniref:OmpA family protein n=1 Tax=Pacificibacter maritimus TaxID=762213 RepID=UPI001FEB26A0|nr:OmpA family protein [Pacificibacter maritimus]